MRYSLALAPDSTNMVQAITLVRVSSENNSAISPAYLNLLPPQRYAAEGEYFMSGEFREALARGELALRIFAADFAVGGRLVRLSQ